MDNKQNIYLVTILDNSEYGFINFNLMTKFTSTLENGNYYYRKVSALKTKPENDKFYVVSSDEGDFAFDDPKLMRKFISPFDTNHFYCRKINVIKTEEELQSLITMSQIQAD